MVQDARNADKEGHVDVVARKDVVDVGTMAGQFLGKPSDGAFLAFQFFFDELTDSFHDVDMCFFNAKNVDFAFAYPELGLRYARLYRYTTLLAHARSMDCAERINGRRA